MSSTYQQLYYRLKPIYGEREAKEIVLLMLEMGFGITMTDVVCGKLDEMNEAERVELERMMLRLERNEPVQYVLGQAYFDGDIYEVTPDVLIPRPETEALCQWIVEEWHGEGRLLDCCTGSGCIAITLKKRCPQLSVDAYDLSSAALKVARRNAERLQQDIRLFQMDALNPIPATAKYDIIVANPPYICEREKQNMRLNVLQFEPPEALFVPDHDPLRFYTAITCYAADALKLGGRLYFEINPLFVDALKTMIRSFGFREIEVDRHFGYDQRMMKAKL
ncbi:MAG: peptide chain release factor N(5)-glutamine methyltransferase [Hoylesella enoeca]|uniref:peptide chain release factor N(5)-glutamine methyltransferase n=1 Tax=Hoylesella enoeca TaxID=76123 RepID=UPI003F9FE20F